MRPPHPGDCHQPRRTDPPGRVRLRLAVAVLVGCTTAFPAVGAAASAQQRARDARAREAVLTADVSRASGRVREVEARLAPAQAKADALARELASLRARRQRLTSELNRQRARIIRLRALLRVERHALAERLSAGYRSQDPGMLELILRTGSLSDITSVRTAKERIADQDRRLITETISHRNQARQAADRIRANRTEVVRTEKRVSSSEREAQRAAAVIAAERTRLVDVLSERRQLLAGIQADRRELEAEARGLAVRSAALGGQIRSAPASPPAAAPTTGGASLAWPVAGPIVSPFGPRWGRMHEGIDIAAGTGTPIAAAAAGTVIVAGPSGGYGNLVVISHGTLATAYAHMSRVSVSTGQSVGRGTVIGAVGCTGHCFGPHVHFEVRVGGAPRSPISYL